MNESTVHWVVLIRESKQNLRPRHDQFDKCRKLISEPWLYLRCCPCYVIYTSYIVTVYIVKNMTIRKQGLGVSGDLALHTRVCTHEQTESRKYNRCCKYTQ